MRGQLRNHFDQVLPGGFRRAVKLSGKGFHLRNGNIFIDLRIFREFQKDEHIDDGTYNGFVEHIQ